MLSTFFIVILLNFYLSDNTKILLYPGSINSHIIFFSQLGKKLAEQGNEVEMLLSTSIKISTSSYHPDNSSGTFSLWLYNTSDTPTFGNEEYLSTLFMNIAKSESPWSQFWSNLQMDIEILEPTENECLDLMRNKQQMSKIEKAKFQFVIVDILAPHCNNLLPVSLGIPYGMYTIPWWAWLYRVPRLSSFTPFSCDRTTNVMTFYERLSTFLKEIIYYVIFEYSKDFSEEFLPPGSEKMGLLKLIEKASLWFFLEDLAVSYPNANMPNTVSIGDIMVNNDIRPLPKDMQEFVSASDGRECVVVALGSFINLFPESVINGFCETFRSLSSKLKFVWKLNSPLEEVCPGAENVMILPWIPQNDLLAHPSVKFFITHGGLNSIIESVNHKKPMIILPIAIDQITNAGMASSKGYAITLSLTSFISKDLIGAINTLLNDPSYKERINFYSAILTDKPNKPEERVSKLINHVVKYGDEHLRSSAFQLSLWQFVMIDVIAFLLFAFVFLILIFILLLWILFKIFKKVCCRKSRTARDSKKKIQ